MGWKYQCWITLNLNLNHKCRMGMGMGMGEVGKSRWDTEVIVRNVNRGYQVITLTSFIPKPYLLPSFFA